MVLSITLNPLLERNLFFKDLSQSSRAYKEFYSAGGKGINVSRQLNQLGIQNHSLTLLGGNKGKIFRSILEKENINFSSIGTKSETREASLIFDEQNKNIKTYFGINSIIADEEVSQFILKMEKAIVNSSIVVFSGSVPSENCNQIIEKGLELCNDLDKISVLDTYGNNLENLIKLGPTVIHNNIDELKKYLNTTLESAEDYHEILNRFYRSGINLGFITNGKNPFYASKADFHYKINNPEIEEINATGSGDSFLSGIIYGLEKSLIFNDFVKLAAALGSLNAASLDVCKVKLENAIQFSQNVSIQEIGKKIKIIDDSPTI